MYNFLRKRIEVHRPNCLLFYYYQWHVSAYIRIRREWLNDAHTSVSITSVHLSTPSLSNETEQTNYHSASAWTKGLHSNQVHFGHPLYALHIKAFHIQNPSRLYENPFRTKSNFRCYTSKGVMSMPPLHSLYHILWGCHRSPYLHISENPKICPFTPTRQKVGIPCRMTVV